jgi:antitoxin component YwqK of YwqJK toxin-antitoxin module
MGENLKINILIALLMFFLFSVNQSHSQTIVSFSKLKERDNKLYLGDQVFSGLVVKTFITNQPKSISEVKDGNINGKVIEFIEDLTFVSKSFKDTAEIKRLNSQIPSKKQELEKAIQDTVKASKEQNDFLYYEIGGNEKLLKLKEKDAEGKLNKNKKEIYDKYEQYVQTNKQCIRKFNDIQLQINNLNQQIKSENDKPTYIPNKALEYNLLNGIKEGAAIVYDSYGNKFGEGSYLNGKQNGKWIYYFSNGKKLAEGTYINGDESNKGASGVPKNGREDSWIFYHENGKIKDDVHYTDGLLNGASKSYFDNGQLNEEENYQNGKLNGVRKVYSENGLLKENGTYVNGLATGHFVFYYESGSIWYEAEYKEGQKNGLEVVYDEEGKKNAEYYVKNDVKHGNEKIYFPNGKVKEERNWEMGKDNGKTKNYFESGGLKTEAQFINGKIHGPFIMYYENGKIQHKGTIDTTSLHNDKFIGDLFSYGEDGSLTKHYYVNADGTVIDRISKIASDSPSTSKNSNSEINKAYNCKCCKAKINSLNDGVNKRGADFNNFELEVYIAAFNENKSFFNSAGYSNPYEYMRKEYSFCSMKCSRTCYSD